MCLQCLTNHDNDFKRKTMRYLLLTKNILIPKIMVFTNIFSYSLNYCECNELQPNL